jgi:hypothetical protein
MSASPPHCSCSSNGAEHYPCALPTTCQPPVDWGDKEAWPALITDISSSTLSLTLERRFERGAGLAIELPSAGGPATVLARVAQIQRQPGSGWALSCSLVSRLSDEEVQSLLAHDREIHAPQPAPLVAWDDLARADAPVQGVLFQVALRPGEVLRWFVKRLDLFGAWPLERGKLIALTFENTPAGAFPIELCVRHCRRKEDRWVVNAHFTTLPDPAVLRALGHPAA